MTKRSFLILFVFSLLLFFANTAFAVNVTGIVTYDSVPVCSMVLANGQYMFTCSGDGSFSLDVPLDANGEITVYAFCSGLAPYKQIITPDQGTGMQINMLAGEAGTGMDVDYSIQAMNTTWALVEGTITYNGTPVCAMALANGQYQFTCSGDGSFSLLVPLDDMGSILLYGFCEGLPPRENLFTTNEIDFNYDYDNDGYTVAAGDCNDFNAAINPGATETCGDGIDQNCDGVDKTCVAVTLTGLTISGSSSINEGNSANYSATALWSDGTTTTVTPTWSENSTYASISSDGTLSTSMVDADQNVTIAGSFTDNGISASDTHSVRIVDIPVPSGSYSGTYVGLYEGVWMGQTDGGDVKAEVDNMGNISIWSGGHIGIGPSGVELIPPLDGYYYYDIYIENWGTVDQQGNITVNDLYPSERINASISDGKMVGTGTGNEPYMMSSWSLSATKQ